MDFVQTVDKTIEKYSMLTVGDTVVIGLSGGADSVALLCSLCAIKEKYKLNLHAAHINHMIRGDEANRDAEYSRSIAEKFGVEFHLLECDIPHLASELGISEEMAGRKVRYEFFGSIGGEKAKIAVAHHKCDSAETTLINMIRGSALNGLKGISPVNGNIIRPLIECERIKIVEFLQSQGIEYMTDSTNSMDIYTRNAVRNKIIPSMAEINPNIISTLFENSRLLGDDEDFINSVCDEYARECIIPSPESVEVDFAKVPYMHIAAKRRLIIKACEILKGNRQGMSSANIEGVLSLPTGGITSFHGIYVCKNYDCFIFSKTPFEDTTFSYNAPIDGTITIGETEKTYRFEIINTEDFTGYEKGNIYLDADKLGKLTLRSRQNGDTFSPLGLGGTKKVKDFLIDLKIPIHIRQTLPILLSDGKIAAILCLRADEAYKVTLNTKRLLKIYEVVL
ncbi:MAG: tRNA lysidine(34) synthetase TilS [Clostridia bacterium]|nr:tRNA lysidine(34) synthetase TilS [Clostridia bacterium]